LVSAGTDVSPSFIYHAPRPKSSRAPDAGQTRYGVRGAGAGGMPGASTQARSKRWLPLG
jgi:hypothetical protein